MTGSVKLPGADEPFTMAEMGISHVLIAFDGGINRKMKIANPDWAPPTFEELEALEEGMAPIPGLNNPQTEVKKEEVPQFLKPMTHQFKVHFLWRPTRLSERLEKRRLAAEGITDEQTTEGDN